MEETDRFRQCSWNELKVFIACKICSKVIEKPVALACMHMFCKPCIENENYHCRNCAYIRFPLPKFSPFESDVLAKCAKIFKERLQISDSSCQYCKKEAYICNKCLIIGCYSEHCTNHKRYCNECNHETAIIDLHAPPMAFINAVTSHKNKQHVDSTSRVIQPKTKFYLNELETLQSLFKNLDTLNCDVSKYRKGLLEKQVMDNEGIETYQSMSSHSLHQECEMLKLQVNAHYEDLLNNTLASYDYQMGVLLNIIKHYKMFTSLLVYVANSDDINKHRNQPIAISCRILHIKGEVEGLVKKVKLFRQQGIVYNRRVHESNNKRVYMYNTEVSSNHLTSSPNISMKITSFSPRLSKQNCLSKKFQFKMLLISGKWYSIGTLPLTSSELVTKEKSNFTVILEFHECICQLDLFLRATSQIKSIYNDKMKVIAQNYKHNMCKTSQQLWQLSKDAINNFNRAIMYLELNNVETYFDIIQKNFEKLEGFVIELYQALRDCKEQALLLKTSLLRAYLPYLNEVLSDREMDLLPTLITYCNLLLDISVAIIRYLSGIYQTCKEIMNFNFFIEGKQISELQEISKNYSFTRSTVKHYATWIAIKELYSVVFSH